MDIISAMYFCRPFLSEAEVVATNSYFVSRHMVLFERSDLRQVGRECQYSVSALLSTQSKGKKVDDQDRSNQDLDLCVAPEVWFCSLGFFSRANSEPPSDARLAVQLESPARSKDLDKILVSFVNGKIPASVLINTVFFGKIYKTNKLNGLAKKWWP